MEKTKNTSENNEPIIDSDDKQKYHYLQVKGVKYRTLYTKNYENRKKWESPDKSMVKSHIPGTIQKIFVKNDQKVKAGQKLLVLEAMKMKNIIHVPEDGIIKNIAVEIGQMVPKGVLMVEMDLGYDTKKKSSKEKTSKKKDSK